MGRVDTLSYDDFLQTRGLKAGPDSFASYLQYLSGWDGDVRPVNDEVPPTHSEE